MRRGVGGHYPASHSKSTASRGVASAALLLSFGVAGFMAGRATAPSAAGASRPPSVPRVNRPGQTTRSVPVQGRHSPPGTASTGRAFTLNWVGDTSFGAGGTDLPPSGPGPVLSGVSVGLRQADLRIGNLEGTLAATGSSKCPAANAKNCFVFRAPPTYARSLRAAGFNVFNVANNHAMDFGPDAQAQTLEALDRAHVAHTGQRGQILHLRAHGIRVAVVGFAPYPWASSLLDVAGAQQLVRRARASSDVVVAIIHAGAEGAEQTHTPMGIERDYGENRGDTRGFAHALIDAGASVVLGSGPHVVRGLERYHGQLIAYSLGDFAGWHSFGMEGPLSLSGMLHLKISGAGRILSGRWISLKLTGAGTPVRDQSNVSAHLVASLSREDFGEMAIGLRNDGHLRLG